MNLVKLPSPLKAVWKFVLTQLSKMKWNRSAAVLNRGIYYKLSETDHDQIRQHLKDEYYIILTRRSSHLSTYMTWLGSWIVNRRSTHYTHALMNIEGEMTGHLGYQLIEATSKGVHFSTFMEVFNCDSVALLRPKNVTAEQWNHVMAMVKIQLGKDYDLFFDFSDDQTLSCVEMVLIGLQSLPGHEEHFGELLAEIQLSGNKLTPHMLYDSGDFHVVFESRK